MTPWRVKMCAVALFFALPGPRDFHRCAEKGNHVFLKYARVSRVPASLFLLLAHKLYPHQQHQGIDHRERKMGGLKFAPMALSHLTCLHSCHISTSMFVSTAGTVIPTVSENKERKQKRNERTQRKDNNTERQNKQENSEMADIQSRKEYRQEDSKTDTRERTTETKGNTTELQRYRKQENSEMAYIQTSKTRKTGRQ